MSNWMNEKCAEYIYDYDLLEKKQIDYLRAYLEKHFPFTLFEKQRACRLQALENEKQIKQLLDSAEQFYPELILTDTDSVNEKNITKFAIVLTAGGEGERLRLSLLAKGFDTGALEDFTKATFALPGFFKDFGTLQINLSFISSLCKNFAFDIPVIVTTGPEGSITARVIPEVLKRHKNFDLKNLLVVKQEERLHLTLDNKIAYELIEGLPKPVTHPDETGGPLMSLKKIDALLKKTPLNWLTDAGAEKILVLQATALYDPRLLFALAAANKSFDCVGVGILRKDFTKTDPFGTFVGLKSHNIKKVMIIEQNVRNEKTYSIKDKENKYFLPYNTGFYAFNSQLLQNNSLPNFATPPKEILPHLERSPKIGYAATDLIGLAKKPAVLAITDDYFSVLKNENDLSRLSELGKKCGLLDLCREYH